jgi:cytochrome oxidase Cu insertion factor (SCO1/SenC/PrrC family)
VQASPTPEAKTAAGNKRSNRMLFIVLAVCAAPLIFSYLTYYVIKPEGRTNYGDLIDPRAHPIPELGLQQLDGQSASLEQFSGKWILLQVDQAACAKPCTDKLYYMRQLRLTQGKEMDRIERVWLVTDDAPLDTALMKQYDGTRLLRVDPKKLAAWLPVQAGTQPADHLYLIDPLGNLMMRFPKDPDANKIKKDISRLLKASRIG